MVARVKTTSRTMPKKTSSEAPAVCSLCAERPSEGHLYVSYSPYEKPKPPPKYSDPPRMERGWSLFLPVCGECCRKSVSFEVKMDLGVKSQDRTWGHVEK